MRNLFLILFCFISSHVLSSEPLKIGVITDVHYLSEKLMDNRYTVQSYVYNSGKNVIVVPEVLDKVLEDYMESKIDVLLVCGDLTKDGEKESHIDFRDRLKPLYDKGVKIFVIPGNHDINMPNALKYQGNKTFETDNISPKDFETIYSAYGYKAAIKRDANSLSYVAELDDNTWLLSIDAARYEEYKERPITAGRIKKETEGWMIDALSDAETQNKQVIAMMHWGAVEHLPLQSAVFNDYLVEDHTRIASLLADNGVKLIFTGHFHSNDITEFASKEGNKIYDIETGPLVSYPFSYRFVDLTKDKADIKTKNIISIPSEANLGEKNKEMMKRIARKRALPMLKNKGLDFSEHHTKQIADIAGELFVLHLYGDEKVDNATKQSLVDIFLEMGFPVDDNLNNIELDLPPLDNNIVILFD